MGKNRQIYGGEPQPLPCPKCGEKMGYSFEYSLKINYSYYYDENGNSEGGQYSEAANITNRGKRAYCLNCVSVLPFKIKHKEEE